MNTSLLRCWLAAGVVATALALAGTAWACIPQPLATLEPRESGPAGSEVTVKALSVAGEAEIRWNGADGPLLGKATGPNFSAPVKIPEAEPGLYTVVVLERAPSGVVGSTARASFLVTGPGGDATTGSAAPGTSGRRSEPMSAAADNSSSEGVPLGAAVAAGMGLVGLGAIGGAAIGRRRSVSRSAGTA